MIQKINLLLSKLKKNKFFIFLKVLSEKSFKRLFVKFRCIREDIPCEALE